MIGLAHFEASNSHAFYAAKVVPLLHYAESSKGVHRHSFWGITQVHLIERIVCKEAVEDKNL